MQALADKVVAGIAAAQGARAFNGVHMRMEKDAADWAIIMGGRARLWQLYKDSMRRAGLDPDTPLYVASGLLKASSEDEWSRDEMRRLTDDIVASQVRAAHIGHAAAGLAPVIAFLSWRGEAWCKRNAVASHRRIACLHSCPRLG